jgi:hypothetical protein
MLSRVIRSGAKTAASFASKKQPLAAASASASARLISPFDVAIRPFSEITPKAESLANLLAHELKHELDNKEVEPDYVAAKETILSKFTIEEKEGTGVVTLTKKHNDETIRISFHVQDEEEVIPEDIQEGADYQSMENMEMDFAIKFRVDVERGDSVVKFDCQAVGESFEILNITGVLPKNISADDEDKVYTGPSFSDIDEELQMSFSTYLEKRGVDSDLSYFIVSHSREREQQLYVNWLKTLKAFVSKK